LKRRDFLASFAALSLAVSDAWAAKTKTTTKPSSTKPATAKTKSGQAKAGTAKPGRKPTGKPSRKITYAPPPVTQVTHTAEDPITE